MSIKHNESHTPTICTGQAPQPTQTIPGSAERIAVLKYRAENGYELHHPEDLSYLGLKRAKQLFRITSFRHNGVRVTNFGYLND